MVKNTLKLSGEILLSETNLNHVNTKAASEGMFVRKKDKNIFFKKKDKASFLIEGKIQKFSLLK